MNILRRLPLSRLLLLCGLVVGMGASATAIAFALGAGPTPPPKPLAQALHDALTAAHGTSVQGVSASISFTDHLLEGANLASGGTGASGSEPGGTAGLTSSPLVTGASGRLWIAKDGDLRLELQSEQGDTQILWDGHTLQLYAAATNTLYRYTPPAQEQHEALAEAALHHVTHEQGGSLSVAQPEIVRSPAEASEVPSVSKIEAALSRLSRHADVSGAIPTDVAGQPAYTVRVSPKEGGSLMGGAELSWDADNGAPLRAAVYSSATSAPVVELAATEVSFGPVESSVFSFTPPPGVKVEEVKLAEHHQAASASHEGSERPTVTSHGSGPAAIVVVEDKGNGANTKNLTQSLGDLPKVAINGVSAAELRTELGTVLAFERSGVNYLVGGLVSPTAVEAVARGL
jgi:outer membrane lipoprotein-sorting protein